MTFDEWCDNMKIKGNWKDALYHSLAAKFCGVDKIPNDPEVWASEWTLVLDSILAKINATA